MLICSSAHPSFTDCEYTGNWAAGMAGGAMLCRNWAWVTVTGCMFRENTALSGRGGALCWDSASYDDTSLLTDCIFAQNAAEEGGAISYWGGRAEIVGCTLHGNSATTDGGAICLTGFTTHPIASCTLYGNAAGGNGGGIACRIDASPRLERMIIAGSTQGEAISSEPECMPELTCCDLFGNAGGDWVGYVADQLGVRNNFCADPRFCDPDSADFQLWNDSPCVHEECGLIGAWPIGCWDSHLPDAPDGCPMGSAIALTCSPNPFTSTTRIHYVLPASAGTRWATLTVHDAAGRLLRRLVAGTHSAGEYSAVWDGCDRHGRRVESGIYLHRLSVGLTSQVTRVLFLQ